MTWNREAWIASFAEQNHDDQMMTLVEDGSCVDVLVGMVQDSARLTAALAAERERRESAEYVVDALIANSRCHLLEDALELAEQHRARHGGSK